MKPVQPKYSITHHPLFIDSLFIPTQQLHVKLILSSPSKQQIQEPVIIACPNEQISLFEIESSLQLKIPQVNLFQSVQSKEPQKKGDKVLKQLQKANLRQLKMKIGHKKQSALQLIYKEQPFDLNNKLKTSIKFSQNRQKYEICLIYLSKKSDVFSVRFQWSTTIDVKKQLLSQINVWYQSQLREHDVQFHRLEIELIPRKQIISFRFLKKPIQSQQQLRQLVFSHQTDAIYLGFDININDFKYRKPLRLLTEQNTININNNNRKSIPIIVEPQQRILVIQFQDSTGMRLDYDQLKQYKIKYLMGILRVPNYDRKGLLVFNKLYLPDQRVSDFQFEYNRKDINFVKAIITSQKKLFMSIMDKELKLQQKQLYQIITNRIQPANNKRFCLSAYLNQAIYAQDNNQKGQYFYQIICNFIEKYFIEIVPFQTKVWARFIKTMVQEIKTLPVCYSEVYRIVEYECSAQQGDEIQFKNFLVTTRQRKKLQQIKINDKLKKTIFKILPKTGRSASKISEFQLNQVIFLPYTSFRIIRKKTSQNCIQIEMEQEYREEQQYKSNLLIWVDDKKQQGVSIVKRIKEITMKYPISFLQLTSNIQFEEALTNKNDLFSDKNVKKIIITNMTRTQNLTNGKLNPIAGIDTLRLVKKNLKDDKTEVIFYIGNIAAAKEKLSKNGFDPSHFRIQTESNNLLRTLVKMCNWEDVKNFNEQIMQQEKLELPLQSKVKVGVASSGIKKIGNQQPFQKQNPWGDMFSKIS